MSIEERVESENKVYQNRRGKTVSKAKTFGDFKDLDSIFEYIAENVETDSDDVLKYKYSITITRKK